MRALRSAPFKLPRTFTGSSVCRNQMSTIDLADKAASLGNMFTGTASNVSVLYDLFPNDLASPWFNGPDGNGGNIEIGGPGDTVQPIQGLHEAASPLTAAGYGKAVCVALTMKMHIKMGKSDRVYNGAGARAFNQVPAYVYCQMASKNNHSAMMSNPPTVDDTFQELKAREGMRLWRIAPGQSKTCVINVGSVLKYLQRSWEGNSSSTGTAAVAPLMQLKAREFLAQNYQLGPPAQYVPLNRDNTVTSNTRIIAATWGIWVPSVEESQGNHFAQITTNMKVIQKVRFYESRRKFGQMDTTVV